MPGAISQTMSPQPHDAASPLSSEAANRPFRPSARHTRAVAEALAKAYPGSRCALDFADLYQLIVATILSAQCTDKRVNMVTPRLFDTFPDAASLAAADPAELESIIRSTGFYKAKAKNLIAMARGLVENHGGLSSNGKWLAGVMKLVGLPNCGTLPDFGNFRVSKDEEYDRYQGVAELMPLAKAVSAKSHDFDADGNETHTDYKKMMQIVLDAGYHGYVGIEYEGSKAPEPEGIKLTKALLERVRTELAG